MAASSHLTAAHYLSSTTPETVSGSGLGFPTSAGTETVGLIAVYRTDGAAPAVVRVEYKDPSSFIRELTEISFACAADSAGGEALIPIEVFSELVGNLIHAGFADPVISILDSGCSLRVADCGPGITDSEQAMGPGYTSATTLHRRYIRGVGAGLHLVQSTMNRLGGSISIDENIGGGAVVTASLLSKQTHATGNRSSDGTEATKSAPEELCGRTHGAPAVHVPAQNIEIDSAAPLAAPDDESAAGTLHLLSARQREVLYMVMASSEAGPTAVASTLGIPLTTAYRDLSLLERMDLVERTADGKRVPTESLMNSSAIWRNL